MGFGAALRHSGSFPWWGGFLWGLVMYGAPFVGVEALPGVVLGAFCGALGLAVAGAVPERTGWLC